MAFRLIDRWPLGLCTLGWCVLICDALVRGGGPGLLDPAVWSFGSLTAGAATARLWWFPSTDARVWAVAISTVVGAARSGAYIAAGLWSPLGVWLIVMGLLAVSFRRYAGTPPS